MNKKKISRLLAGTLAGNVVINMSAATTHAIIREVSQESNSESSTEDSSEENSSIDYSAEEASGVSAEQMQSDFENATKEYVEEVDEDLQEEDLIPDGTVVDGEEYIESNYINVLAEENTLATFSFDGDNAGKIVIIDNSIVDGTKFKYSLDGGSTWSYSTDRVIELSESQINSINASNDIKIGVDGNSDYLVTIDILAGAAPTVSDLYKNDWENRFFGRLENLQVSTDGGSTWRDYDSSMTFSGRVVTKVRYKAHGVYTTSPASQFTYQADTVVATRKYVSVDNINYYDAFSEQDSKFTKGNLVNGNGNNSWMSLAKTSSDEEMYYTVGFNSIKFFNSIEYTPYDLQKGRLKSGKVYVSYDNENWKLAAEFSDLANNTNVKTINFTEPMSARYIKIVATETYQDGSKPNTVNTYMSGKMLNFYEDSTLQYSSEPVIKYSITDSTASPVTATLYLPEGCEAEVTTHKFLVNGTHIFEYRDAEGNTKTVEASVDWITLLSGDKGVYLSDMDYVESMSDAWDGVKIDKNPASGTIQVFIDGQATKFTKGLGIHAPSTVVYDIESYKNEYTNFSAYLGVDKSRVNTVGSVKFVISASVDGDTWDTLHTTGVLTGSTDASYVNVDVSGYNYVKLYADNDGNSSNDHSVYADARLIRSNYNVSSEFFTRLKTLAQYDESISSRSIEENYQYHKHEILEREFVNRIGYDNIVSYARDDENIANALNWLLDDKDALQLFIEAGTFEFGTGERAIKALGALYEKYGNIVGDSGDAYVYKKMLIATAVAYSRQIMTFMTEYYKGSYVESDPVKRFAIYKNLYDSDLLAYKDDFVDYEMELLRAVMDAKMDDNDIYWLRKYTEERYPSSLKDRFYIYNYMKYLTPNYNGDDLYSEVNRNKWDEKYNLTEYGFTGYGEKYRHRLWMLFEKGGICWTISNAGLNIQEVHGIPGVNIYQPGHEAYFTYSKDSEGNGIWSIGNTIGNWENSFSYWYGLPKNQARLLLGWGNRSYNSNGKNNGSYMLLAQAALNKNDDYVKSMYYNLLANSYANGSEDREKCYEKALEHLDINLDSIDGLIESYKVSNKSSAEWFELGKMVTEVYKYYPVPMVEAVNRILPYVTDNMKKAELTLLKTNSLYDASVATSAESLQADACKRIAKSLLGTQAVDLASFSFDGEYAGVIKLHETYEGMDVRIKYSLDGGTHYEEVKGTEVKLTEEELASITPENDIKVGLVGSSAIFTIDILDSGSVSGSIYLNDDENLLIGGNLENVEYSVDGGETWKDYVSGLKSDTRIEGDVTALFRYKAHGVYTRGASTTYKFTENGDTDTSKYIQLRNISLYKYSSEQNNSDKAAKNLFDGNYNTRWHNTWNWKDTEKYISVEFDKVRFVSKLSYLSYDASGRLKDGNVYTSLDGETWTKVCEYKDLLNTNGWKTIDLGGSFAAKYVKIDSTQSHGLYSDQKNLYVSGRMLNFYEDTTKVYEPNAEIKYSTVEPTNGVVKATLVLSEGCLSEELSYTFEENGTHDFIYIDANGDSHTITAEVNNIDRELPTMTYEFDNNNPTKENVTMTVTGFSEDGVTIISVEDENGNLVDEDFNIGNSVDVDEDFTINDSVDDSFNSNTGIDTSIDNGFIQNEKTYVFEDNKTLVFKIKDLAGNISTVPVTVDWIDREAPIAKIEYDITDPTSENVKATITFNEEDVTVLNTEGNVNYHIFESNDEFTFEFRDKAGNEGKITAVVNWIDKEESKAYVVYDKETLTNQNVTATLEGLAKDEKVEGGITSHVFTENGTHDFVVVDKAGNRTVITAEVTWIDKEAPKATITYDYNSWTNNSVKAAITFNEEGVEIINNGGSDTYVFDVNNNFTFEFRDKAGNVGTATAEVTWIDKDAPTANVKYSTMSPTKDYVTVELVNLSEEVTVENNGGKFTYTFNSNGKFEFIIVDRAGNKTTIPVEVNWIDNEAPDVHVEYDVTQWTNGNVVAKVVGLKDDEQVVGESTYIFIENGTHEFIVKDSAGNITKVEAKVTWIDKEAPNVKVKYNTTDPTNQYVIASVDGLQYGETVVSEGGSVYVFDNNGTHEFIVRDLAGNETRVTAEVTWIDKKAPEVTVEYSEVNPTRDNVTAYLKGVKEDEYIVNEGRLDYHLFTENGEYVFIVRDLAGNETRIVAKVENIDREDPTAEVMFDSKALVEGRVVARLVNASEKIKITNTENGVNYYEFKENGEFIFEFEDEAGNKGSAKVVVDWLDFENKEEVQDVISFTGGFYGDVSNNEDGKFDYTIATVNLDRDKFELIGEDGEVLDKSEFMFIENGTYTIRARMIGSEEEFDIIVEVDWLTGGEGEIPTVGDDQSQGKPSDEENTSDEEGNSSDEDLTQGDESQDEDQSQVGDTEDSTGEDTESESENIDPDFSVDDESGNVDPGFGVDSEIDPGFGVDDESSNVDPGFGVDDESGNVDSDFGVVPPVVDETPVVPPVEDKPVTPPTDGGNNSNASTGGNGGSTGGSSGGNGGSTGGNGGSSGGNDEDDNSTTIEPNPPVDDSSNEELQPVEEVRPVIPTDEENHGSSNVDNNYTEQTPSQDDNLGDAEIHTDEDNSNSGNQNLDKTQDNNTTNDSKDNNTNHSNDHNSIESTVEEHSNGFIATVVSIVSTAASAIYVWLKRMIGIDL